MKLSEIISVIESFAPLAYQENYDNAGLVTGDPTRDIKKALITVDVTEKIIDEAVNAGADLIISHHPVIFNEIKKITGSTYTERIIIKAIKKDLAIYSAHTNLDNIKEGVNLKICQKLGLTNPRILSPVKGELRKLVTFVPLDHADNVRLALFSSGAGQIGEYEQCSYNLEGLGTFRGSENTNPYTGEKGKLHFEKEIRIETIFPKAIESKVISALITTHPYEEVAYDIYPLDNYYDRVGMGMIGELEKETDELSFLSKIKSVFNTKVIKHSRLKNKSIKRVAVCGGSGSKLIKDAIQAQADIFITGDIRYHQFFEASDKIIIADIGHYESEQFTKEIFYELLKKKLPKFALHLSEYNTDPIKYF
jgi:dinuclear metal center YbgI/SA1388 family protein